MLDAHGRHNEGPSSLQDIGDDALRHWARLLAAKGQQTVSRAQGAAPHPKPAQGFKREDFRTAPAPHR